MSAPVLEARRLSKSFADVRAVRGVSFTLGRGEVCGLLGPNGAGKSTTIRMLLGLVTPDDGEAVILGEPVKPGAPVLGRVGAIVEEAAFYPFLNGRANLTLDQRLGGHKDPEDIDRVLDLVGLSDVAHRKVKTYSHGMRQRLGIARALLGAPDLLVLDEPTTGLDPAGMKDVRELLRRLAGGGVSILLSSHLLSEIEITCDAVLVMRSGEVIASGSVAGFTGGGRTVIEVDDVGRALASLRAIGMAATETVPGRVVVDHDGRPTSEAIRSLVENGISVNRAEPGDRLEDVFLRITEEGT